MRALAALTSLDLDLRQGILLRSDTLTAAWQPGQC